MIKIYGSIDRLMVGHIKNILENHGINCTIRNHLLSSNAGFIPVNEILPEIWIADKSQYEKARMIIEDALYSKETTTDSPWECVNCKETIEPQFTECWKCGNSKQD